MTTLSKPMVDALRYLAREPDKSAYADALGERADVTAVALMRRGMVKIEPVEQFFTDANGERVNNNPWFRLCVTLTARGLAWAAEDELRDGKPAIIHYTQQTTGPWHTPLVFTQCGLRLWGGRPFHAKGLPDNVTDDEHKTTCKSCLRSLSARS